MAASSSSEQERTYVAFVGKHGAGEESLVNLLCPSTNEDATASMIFTPIKLKEGRQRNKQALEDLGKVDILVYCLSVDPDLKFKSANPSIMRSIQDVYGEDIWKRCILAFTFSNVVWKKILKKNNFNASKAIIWYRKHLQKYADLFRKGLAEMQVTANVKVAFDIDLVPGDLATVTIPAIPVGEDLEDQVLPKVPRITQDATSKPIQDIYIEAWRDVLLIEIDRKYKGNYLHPLIVKYFLN